MRDRESHAPEAQQDIVHEAVPQVARAPGTGTSGIPGLGVSQVTGSGTQGAGFIPVAGAGAQVTGQGTRGSVGGSTDAGTTRAGSGLQGASVGPAHGHSPSRDTGCSEE